MSKFRDLFFGERKYITVRNSPNYVCTTTSSYYVGTVKNKKKWGYHDYYIYGNTQGGFRLYPYFDIAPYTLKDISFTKPYNDCVILTMPNTYSSGEINSIDITGDFTNLSLGSQLFLELSLHCTGLSIRYTKQWFASNTGTDTWVFYPKHPDNHGLEHNTSINTIASITVKKISNSKITLSVDRGMYSACTEHPCNTLYLYGIKAYTSDSLDTLNTNIESIFSNQITIPYRSYTNFTPYKTLSTKTLDFLNTRIQNKQSLLKETITIDMMDKYNLSSCPIYGTSSQSNEEQSLIEFKGYFYKFWKGYYIRINKENPLNYTTYQNKPSSSGDISSYNIYIRKDANYLYYIETEHRSGFAMNYKNTILYYSADGITWKSYGTIGKTGDQMSTIIYSHSPSDLSKVNILIHSKENYTETNGLIRHKKLWVLSSSSSSSPPTIKELPVPNDSTVVSNYAAETIYQILGQTYYYISGGGLYTCSGEPFNTNSWSKVSTYPFPINSNGEYAGVLLTEKDTTGNLFATTKKAILFDIDNYIKPAGETNYMVKYLTTTDGKTFTTHYSDIHKKITGQSATSSTSNDTMHYYSSSTSSLRQNGIFIRQANNKIYWCNRKMFMNVSNFTTLFSLAESDSIDTICYPLKYDYYESTYTTSYNKDYAICLTLSNSRTTWTLKINTYLNRLPLCVLGVLHDEDNSDTSWYKQVDNRF